MSPSTERAVNYFQQLAVVTLNPNLVDFFLNTFAIVPIKFLGVVNVNNTYGVSLAQTDELFALLSV